MASSPRSDSTRAGALRWALLALAGVVLVAHSLAYNFVTDDAYISFVFSRNFAEHGQLVFNLGQPVEGYTNFLWTLILGVGMVAHVPPELSSRVLATLCALGTLYLALRITERALGRRSPWAAVPALLLACASGFACWTSGGLETQLYTVLVTGALDGLVAATEQPRALRRAGICLALAAMTRPEGPMIAAIFGATWFVVRLFVARAPVPPSAATPSPPAPPSRLRAFVPELTAIAWFLALWAPWFAWRWWYYGWPFPNTYYVKASGRWASPEMPGQMLGNGFHYVWVWLRQTHILYVAPFALLGLVARRRTPRFTLALASALFLAIYLAYTISVGGDFMGLHRFIMPVFVFAALAVALGVHRAVAALRPRLLLPAGALLIVGFAITQAMLTRESLRFGNFANDRGIDTPAFLIAYTEDRAAIGRAMAPCFAPDDFSIVGGAGAQPYYGRMRAIDVFGLVSSTIAHDEPRIRARAGHTKFGSDATLAAYDPTFVFSCYQIHRTPNAPTLPCGGYWRGRGYEQVTMHIPGMREQGEYYTFLAKASRAFTCPGRVP